jgi:serine/threonine protein kinase
MGVVYLAEDPAGHRVALKLVRPELADDAAFRARFRREVEAGQRVGGICTAKYIDADLESEHPYLVTEYVEAGNLADYVASQGPLADEQLIGLAVGLAEAIVAMHASGVIHRDLKPSNVLMAPSGPKVVDFGISHAADGTALTQTGVIVGSPSWMSPEQAQGRETTPAVDVFAWGATVAFAATGRFPFGEGRPDAVIYRVVHEDPDLSGVDPKLRSLVAAALNKDPSSRPAADKLLVDVVKTAMAGELPPGGSVAMTTLVLDRTWVKEPPTPTRPKTRRGRQIALIAAFIVLILAAAAVAITALVTRGSGTTKATHGVATSSRSTTTAATSTTAPPTTLTAPPTSSVMTYSTGQPNAGWPTYDIFTGNCSSVVATYQFSWMGLMSAPTPITVPAGGLVQLGGSQTTDNTITVTSGPATISLPAGLPYPQSDQAGVLVAGHDSLISYKCG